MKALRRFVKRLRSWARTGPDEERLQAEIEEHLALQTAENLRAGLSPAEARRQAVLKFGAVEGMREEYRDQRGLPVLETLLQDTRHALRRLRMAPAFTITTILTLALGIGATTSIFTLVHAILLKSLPVASPSELYRLGKEPRCCYQGGYSQEKEFSLVSYELYGYLETTLQGSPNWRPFQRSSRCWVCAARAVQKRHKAIRASLFRETISGCSELELLPDARFRPKMIRPALRRWQ